MDNGSYRVTRAAQEEFQKRVLRFHRALVTSYATLCPCLDMHHEPAAFDQTKAHACLCRHTQHTLIHTCTHSPSYGCGFTFVWMFKSEEREEEKYEYIKELATSHVSGCATRVAFVYGKNTVDKLTHDAYFFSILIHWHRSKSHRDVTRGVLV